MDSDQLNKKKLPATGTLSSGLPQGEFQDIVGPSQRFGGPQMNENQMHDNQMHEEYLEQKLKLQSRMTKEHLREKQLLETELSDLEKEQNDWLVQSQDRQVTNFLTRKAAERDRLNLRIARSQAMDKSEAAQKFMRKYGADFELMDPKDEYVRQMKKINEKLLKKKAEEIGRVNPQMARRQEEEISEKKQELTRKYGADCNLIYHQEAYQREMENLDERHANYYNKKSQDWSKRYWSGLTKLETQQELDKKLQLEKQLAYAKKRRNAFEEQSLKLKNSAERRLHVRHYGSAKQNNTKQNLGYLIESRQHSAPPNLPGPGSSGQSFRMREANREVEAKGTERSPGVSK